MHTERYESGESVRKTSLKAFSGSSTDPKRFSFFFPSFCFSRSFFFRETSPP